MPAYLEALLVERLVMTLVACLVMVGLVWVGRRSTRLAEALLWGTLLTLSLSTVGLLVLAKVSV